MSSPLAVGFIPPNMDGLAEDAVPSVPVNGAAAAVSPLVLVGELPPNRLEPGFCGVENIPGFDAVAPNTTTDNISHLQ